MPYRKGDVILVPFAFTDRSGVKRRPAVVVSGDDYNQQTPDIVIASITGNLYGQPDRAASPWRSSAD